MHDERKAIAHYRKALESTRLWKQQETTSNCWVLRLSVRSWLAEKAHELKNGSSLASYSQDSPGPAGS